MEPGDMLNGVVGVHGQVDQHLGALRDGQDGDAGVIDDHRHAALRQAFHMTSASPPSPIDDPERSFHTSKGLGNDRNPIRKHRHCAAEALSDIRTSLTFFSVATGSRCEWLKHTTSTSLPSVSSDSARLPTSTIS